MAHDVHGRARLLIDKTRVAGVSREDELWLRGHTESCADCAAHAELTTRIVQDLSSFAFELAPGMHDRVKEAVVAEVERLSACRRRFPMRFARWALAGATLAILIVPWTYVRYRQAAGERERAEAALLDGVATRVSRDVPRAMEPLVQ